VQYVPATLGLISPHPGYGYNHWRGLSPCGEDYLLLAILFNKSTSKCNNS